MELLSIVNAVLTFALGFIAINQRQQLKEHTDYIAALEEDKINQEKRAAFLAKARAVMNSHFNTSLVELAKEMKPFNGNAGLDE